MELGRGGGGEDSEEGVKKLKNGKADREREDEKAQKRSFG